MKRLCSKCCLSSTIVTVSIAPLWGKSVSWKFPTMLAFLSTLQDVPPLLWYHLSFAITQFDQSPGTLVLMVQLSLRLRYIGDSGLTLTSSVCCHHLALFVAHAASDTCNHACNFMQPLVFNGQQQGLLHLNLWRTGIAHCGFTSVKCSTMA